MEELHEDLRNSVAYSGEKDLFAIGRKAMPGSVRRCGSPPARGIIQRCDCLEFSASETSTAEKATQRPSGERVKSPTRLRFIMSSKVKGRFWATAARETSRIQAMSRRRSIRGSPGQEQKSLPQGHRQGIGELGRAGVFRRHACALDRTLQREAMHPGPGAGEEHCESEDENDNDRNDGGLAGALAHWLRSALHAVDSTPGVTKRLKSLM
jgi:hypothetical protein